MTYFTPDHHNALLSLDNGHIHDDLQGVYTRLMNLHQAVYVELKRHQFGLHPTPDIINTGSISTPFPAAALSVAYMRPQSHAIIVERIMGRDRVNTKEKLNPRLHPVIEVRLTPDHFVIELVIAPDAWYDQQNFMGKLSIRQHRRRFYEILADMGMGYYLGFWSGIHLSDMSLTTDQLPPASILLDFVDTFAAGRDYLRLGYWYEPGAGLLTDIQTTVFDHIDNLMPMYRFILWAGDNNFHSFYKKAHKIKFH